MAIKGQTSVSSIGSEDRMCLVIEKKLRSYLKEARKLRRKITDDVNFLRTLTHIWRLRVYCFLGMGYVHKKYTEPESETCNPMTSASVTLRNILFKGHVMTELMDAKANCINFIFCTISYRSQIYITDSLEYKVGKELFFNGIWSFQNLHDDFVILVQVWKISFRIEGNKYIEESPVVLPIAKREVHICSFYNRDRGDICNGDVSRLWYSLSIQKYKVCNVKVKKDCIFHVDYYEPEMGDYVPTVLTFEGDKMTAYALGENGNSMLPPLGEWRLRELLPDEPVRIEDNMVDFALTFVNAQEQKTPFPESTVVSMRAYGPFEAHCVLQHIIGVSTMLNYLQQNKLFNNNIIPPGCVYQYFNSINLFNRHVTVEDDSYSNFDSDND